MERDTAARRGTAAHSGAEYLLKTANRLTRNTANRRNAWRTTAEGWSVRLQRSPAGLWGRRMHRSQRCPGALLATVAALMTGSLTTSTPSTRLFSSSSPSSIKEGHGGFAGTADALLEIQGMAGPCIVDWKTTQRPDCPDYALAQYKLQMSAYSIGVEELTGLRPAGACIVVTRKSGPALDPSAFSRA